MTQKPKSWIGQTLGERYQIEALLGRGGMSSVYRASDNNLKRAVAVKIIHPHLTKQPEFVRQFEQEATAVAQLRHQNIVRVHDFKQENGTYYMVMEYIPGETLAEKLAALNEANMHLQLTESVRIAINLCDAVDYAHQRRMIHRDIKPANVMINLLGEPILMDFGIAKLVGRDFNNLGDQAALGSAQYMAPEQVQGEQIDFRTDIYALGVVLFEMLSGFPPFRGSRTKEIFELQVNAKTPDLHFINPDIPQTLIAIVERAMEKLPERRYQTAADMVTALQSVVLTLQNPLEAIGTRQMEHLARLWLQASQAFDEENYIGCIEKVDELNRTGADYQAEQAAQLRQDSVKALYDQALAFFQEGQFGEALVVVTALRDMAPSYPNLSHLDSQIRQSVQSNSIQSDLDLLYDEAVTHLEAHEYEKALDKWETIEVERKNLPYRDRMNVEERAKSGICARLYNDAFVAISEQKPNTALYKWKQIKAIDPDFPDEDGILDLVQRMLDTNKGIQKRDKWLLIGAVTAGIIFLLFAFGWRAINNEERFADGTGNNVQAAALVTEPATKSPTATTIASETAVSTPKEAVLEDTKSVETATSTVTSTPTATLPPTATATPPSTESPTSKPTDTPTSSPTPTNVGLVLENASLFNTPSPDGEELAVVEEGDNIIVMGRAENDNWLFVGNGDQTGFVFRNLLQWDGDVSQLQIYTHTNTGQGNEVPTPFATKEITPLSFDLWPLPDTAVCTESGWEQDIFFQGHGGNGIYAYYWDDKLVDEPTNGETIYRLVSAGGPVAGIGRVESGAGAQYWQEKPLYIDPPNCP
jgi:tRNA A-37 threonylcarbamoyl transferase component Bud32